MKTPEDRVADIFRRLDTINRMAADLPKRERHRIYNETLRIKSTIKKTTRKW